MKKSPVDAASRLKKSLPYLKKSQSIFSSPRPIPRVHLSPDVKSSDPIDLKDSSPASLEHLHITKLEDQLRKSIKHSSCSNFSKQKKSELFQIVEVKKPSEEDHKEKQEKPEKLEYMIDTLSSLKKKTDIEIKRDSNKRNNYKDFEILNQKQKADEYLEYINVLLTEVNELKQKNKGLVDSCLKITLLSQETENILHSTQDKLKVTETKLEQTQKDLTYKSHELTDMQDLLKKSEDKRKAANELTADFESKLVFFQKSNLKLQKQNSDLMNDLKNSADVTESKEVLLRCNTERIQELEIRNEELLLTVKRGQLLYDNAVSEMQGKINLMRVGTEKLEAENQRLQERLNEAQESFKRTATQAPLIKRSETVSGAKFLSEISQEEAMRWHSRYFALEQELNLNKEQLEKVKKNENYFKAQIEQKNLMIERMEFIIKNNEKSVETGEKTKETADWLAEMEYSVEVLIGRAKSVEENFKCGNCFMFSGRNQICMPCGHLVCDKCEEECREICGRCANRTEGLIGLENLKKLAEFYVVHMSELVKLKEMLRVYSV